MFKLISSLKKSNGGTMKNFYRFLFLIFWGVVSFSIAQSQTSFLQTESGVHYSQADVMGRSITFNPATGETEILSGLNFTLFPGYPVTQSGSTIEGSIFCNMDADPELEIVVCIGQATYAFNLDGSPVTGWPKTISQAPSGAPAFGDIDGDGEGEIVIGSYFGSSSGNVYAYEKDGSTVTGFPINSGYVTRSVTLADLNNDGAMEIIVSKRTYPTGQVAIYKGDGTVYPGWPQDIITVPAASAAVGDVTGDNVPEIVFEAYSSLYVWDTSGNLLTGFPFDLPTDVVTSYSSPILADIDNDNMNEILFGVHELSGAVGGRIYCLNGDGTSVSGWPVYTTYWVYAPPTVGYIDGDNQIDVAVGDQVLSGTPVDKVYAWDKDGNLLSGFPVTLQNAINAQIILADIDGDDLTELIYDDNVTETNGDGYYHAVNHDGSTVAGWPLITTGTTFFQTPCITDINRDGTMDMIGGGTTGFGSGATTEIYLWNTQLPYTISEIQVPMFQYNTMHNGVYTDPSLVPVELISFTAVSAGSNVNLNWTTATEINNQGFEIQRSADKKEFVTVGFVKGAGTSTNENYYSFTDKNISGSKYFYRLKQVDFDGTYSYSDIVEVDILILDFHLAQNYPNPFNPSTTIEFSLPEKSDINLSVYNTLGEKVVELLNGEIAEGFHKINFDASSLTSGIYFYRLSSKNFNAVEKMILMK